MNYKQIIKKDMLFVLVLFACIGFFGGLVYGAYDVGLSIIIVDAPLASPSEFFHLAKYPMFIYALFGTLGMALFGSLAFFSLQLGNIKLSKEQFAVLSIIICAFIIFSAVIYDMNKRGVELDKLYVLYMLVFGGLSSTGLFFWLRWFLDKASVKITAISGAGVYCLVLITWFVAVWFFQKYPELDLIPPKNTGLNIENSPNILLIVMDTARADHFSCYGYQRQTTTKLDKFATQGTIYTNAVSSSPWTLPSHASMLTGLYPSSHGADGAWKWLGNKFITLSEMLGEHGYTTAAFSNNFQFSKQSNLSQGFDQFVYMRTDNQWGKELLLGRAIRVFMTTMNIEHKSKFIDKLIVWLTVKPKKHDLGAAETNKMIKKYLAQIPEQKAPFFLMVNYMETHKPYGNKPNSDQFLGELDMALSEALVVRDRVAGDIIKVVAQKPEFSTADKKVLNALYDGDLFYLDKKVGEIIDYLDQIGVLDQTIVIITSDHGENIGDHNLIDHVQDIHRTLTHVPMIIRYPAKFSPGARVDRIVQTIDIFPTICEVVQIPCHQFLDIQGISLLDPTRPQIALSEARFKQAFVETAHTVKAFHEVDQREFVGTWISIQTPKYDFISSSLSDHLYDITEDPYEQNDIILGQPQVSQQMRELMNKKLKEINQYWKL